MKSIFIVIIVLFSFNKSFSQNKFERDLILTNDQNDKWFLNLKSLPKEEKLDFVVKRMVLDTNIYLAKGNGVYKTIGANSIENKFKGCCRPMFLIVKNKESFEFGYGEGKGHIGNNNNISIVAFAKQLNKIKVEEIITYTGASAAALYGSKAIGGIVIINIKDDESYKILHQVVYN